MLLAIDVRNTHTVVGLIAGAGDHAKVLHYWRVRTEPEVTSDELALTIEGLIGDDSERLTGVTGLSTVPSVLHEVRGMLDQYWSGVPHVLIEPGIRTGIPLLVDNPKEVGADRIVNCLAAHAKFSLRRSLLTSVRRSVWMWSRRRASSWAVQSLRVSSFPLTPRPPARLLCAGWSSPGPGRFSVKTPWNACNPAQFSGSPGLSTAWSRAFEKMLRDLPAPTSQSWQQGTLLR